MTGDSVRAILDNRKTQTRRVVTRRERDEGEWVTARPDLGWTVDRIGRDYPCPYGAVGDRLWVRETWQYADWTEDGYPFIGYAADGSRSLRERYDESWSERVSDTWAELSAPANYGIDGRAADRRWRPSIHMPRWASRLTLEITDVRIERLCEITENDAKAEGVGRESWPEDLTADDDSMGAECGYFPHRSYRAAYANLWDEINGKRAPWDSNPWVWVLELRRA